MAGQFRPPRLPTSHTERRRLVRTLFVRYRTSISRSEEPLQHLAFVGVNLPDVHGNSIYGLGEILVELTGSDNGDRDTRLVVTTESNTSDASFLNPLVFHLLKNV